MRVIKLSVCDNLIGWKQIIKTYDFIWSTVIPSEAVKDRSTSKTWIIIATLSIFFNAQDFSVVVRAHTPWLDTHNCVNFLNEKNLLEMF